MRLEGSETTMNDYDKDNEYEYENRDKETLILSIKGIQYIAMLCIYVKAKTMH